MMVGEVSTRKDWKDLKGRDLRVCCPKRGGGFNPPPLSWLERKRIDEGGTSHST